MENSIIEEIRFDDAEEFIQAISYGGNLFNTFNSKCIYRGLSSDKYKLIPSALRVEVKEELCKLANQRNLTNDWEIAQIHIEFELLKSFYKCCDYNCLFIPNSVRLRESLVNSYKSFESLLSHEKWLPSDLLELAALAQHYGIPTRLLDWSYDFFVSLYFAVNGVAISNNPSNYFVIWIMNLNSVEYLISSGMPLRIINPPYFGNPNLGAQKGVFTMWEIDKPMNSSNPKIVDVEKKITKDALDYSIQTYVNSNNPKLNTPLMHKILVSTKNIYKIHQFLEKMNYNASRIFPGYYGVVRSIFENSKWEDIKFIFTK